MSNVEAVGCGAILYCHGGEADISVNFSKWRLSPSSVFVLFPGDVLMVERASDYFIVEAIAYSPAILREASFQIEHTVYSSLRLHRLCTRQEVRDSVVEGMFSIFRFFFAEKNCDCVNEIVSLQLKSFFIGFYDYIIRCAPQLPQEEGSRRTNELFNSFMQMLERYCKLSHNVSYYADRLFITPKYLGMIVMRKTGKNTKDLIAEFVVLQLKMSLSASDATVNQLAHEYNFSDAAFLCRYFKRYTGMTPQQYRNARKK